MREMHTFNPYGDPKINVRDNFGKYIYDNTGREAEVQIIEDIIDNIDLSRIDEKQLLSIYKVKLNQVDKEIAEENANKVHFEHLSDAGHVATFMEDESIEVVSTCYGYKGFTVFYKKR